MKYIYTRQTRRWSAAASPNRLRYRPAVFFCRLRLIVTSFHGEKNKPHFRNDIFLFFYVLKLHRSETGYTEIALHREVSVCAMLLAVPLYEVSVNYCRLQMPHHITYQNTYRSLISCHLILAWYYINRRMNSSVFWVVATCRNPEEGKLYFNSGGSQRSRTNYVSRVYAIFLEKELRFRIFWNVWWSQYQEFNLPLSSSLVLETEVRIACFRCQFSVTIYRTRSFVVVCYPEIKKRCCYYLLLLR